MSYFPRFHDFPRKRRGKIALIGTRNAHAQVIIYIYFSAYIYIYMRKNKQRFSAFSAAAPAFIKSIPS